MRYFFVFVVLVIIADIFVLLSAPDSPAASIQAQQVDSCRRFYDKAVEFASTAYVPEAFTKHNPHDTQLSMMYSQLYRTCVVARTSDVNSR